MSNYGYSRRRPASKGDVAAPTERVQQNAVTGEIERTVLDNVQLAFENVRRWYETAGTLFHLSPAGRERLADMVILMVAATKRHTDAQLEALAGLLKGMG